MHTFFFSTGLNECLERHTYTFPSTEEIVFLITGKVYENIDLYKLKNWPYKLKKDKYKKIVNKSFFNTIPDQNGTEHLQQVIDMIIAGLDFAIAYLDNMLIKKTILDGNI